MAKVKLN